jgi:hypothetical protein
MKTCTTCGQEVDAANIGGLCAFHYNEARSHKRIEMDSRIAGLLGQRRKAADIAQELSISINRVHKVSAEMAPGRPVVRLAAIIRLVSAHTGCSIADMQGKSRQRSLVLARHAICLLASEVGHSLPRIGRALGGRDHSTIFHGRDTASARASEDPEYAALLDLVRSGSMPEAEPEPEPAPLTLDDMEPQKRPTFTPLPAALVARATRRLRIADTKPRNDFAADEDDDSGHLFHQGIAAGSRALYDAILRARAA